MADEQADGWAARRPYLAFALFWLIACGFSWSFFLLRPGPAAGPDSFVMLLSHPLRLLPKFGPTLAGLVLLATGGPAVRHRFVGGLRSPRPILLVLAVLVPGVLAAAALALGAQLGGLEAGLVLSGFSLAGAAYWVALRTLIGGGMGEEPGLRGVALPLLLSRLEPRLAAAILGLCWALWHLPVLWGHPPLTWIGQLVLTLSISLTMTFVWVRIGPSLWAAILFHGAINGWDHFAAVEWAPQLQAHNAWQVLHLAALLAIALALLPMRWSRPGQPKDISHAHA